jgi:hypothetical protein
MEARAMANHFPAPPATQSHCSCGSERFAKYNEEEQMGKARQDGAKYAIMIDTRAEWKKTDRSIPERKRRWRNSK